MMSTYPGTYRSLLPSTPIPQTLNFLVLLFSVNAFLNHNLSISYLNFIQTLKGLAMIFAGQENLLIIFWS